MSHRLVAHPDPAPAVVLVRRNDIAEAPTLRVRVLPGTVTVRLASWS